MSDTKEDTTQPGPKPALRQFPKTLVLTGILMAVCGAGAGAVVTNHWRHVTTYVALNPAPISAMKDRSDVALEGGVAETFGNKFVLQDSSGRALVETGRSGEGGSLVKRDERVVVQGRFEHGFVHAVSIRHADGRTDNLDPPPPPPRGDRVEDPRPM